MTLTDLASWGSLLSSVAVLVSLLFVGVQIRQSNRNQRSLMQQGRSARNVDLLCRLTDPKLSELLLRVLRGETVTDSEYLMLYGYIASVFWSYEDSFLQFRSGTLDAKSWASDVATLKRLLKNPAYRAVWRAAKEAMASDYSSFIDSVVVEGRQNAPADVPSVLKQYIAEEKQALTKLETDRPAS